MASGSPYGLLVLLALPQTSGKSVDLLPEREGPISSSVSGAGPTSRRTCARRTATGTCRRTGTTTWGSASPARFAARAGPSTDGPGLHEPSSAGRGEGSTRRSSWPSQEGDGHRAQKGP